MAETDMRLGSSTTLGRCRGVPLNDTLRCHQTWVGNPIEISILEVFMGNSKKKWWVFPEIFQRQMVFQIATGIECCHGLLEDLRRMFP